MKHGVRTSYTVHGCRCSLCRDAQSAYCWARKQLPKWELELPIDIDYGSWAGEEYIERQKILDAINKHETQIKINALEALWYETIKK